MDALVYVLPGSQRFLVAERIGPLRELCLVDAGKACGYFPLIAFIALFGNRMKKGFNAVMRDTESFFRIFVLPCVGTGIDATLADLVLIELVTHLRLPELAGECDFEPFKPTGLPWKRTAFSLTLGSDAAGSHQ